MQRLIDTLQRHNISSMVVGAAARHRLQHQAWGITGIVEILVQTSTHQLLEWFSASPYQMIGISPNPSLSFESSTSRSETWRVNFPEPLVLDIQIQGHHQWAYLYPCPSTSSWFDLLVSWMQLRGFRLESLAVSLEGEVFDPLQIRSDLDQGVLALGIPATLASFQQQPHYLLSLASLVSELGFQPPSELLTVADKYAPHILYSPRQTWLHGLTLLLCGSHVERGLQLLFDIRVLGLLLPEIYQMVGFAETSLHHHKDLWKHTCRVVSQAVCHPLVRWAALLHDVGKLWTRTYGPNRTVHFYLHEELGAILVDGIGARLCMPPTLIQDIAFLVRHHLRPNAYHSSWTDAAIRRLIREAGHLLTPLLQLSQADTTSGILHKQQQTAQLSAELWTRTQHILHQDSRRPLLPKGMGTAIMTHFSWVSGPSVGKLKIFLEQQIQASVLLPHQDSAYYTAYLQNLPSLTDIIKSFPPERHDDPESPGELT